MGFVRHFFSGSRQEVNITWYPEIEEPIKSREKHYSLVLYILTSDNWHIDCQGSTVCVQL